MSRCSSRREEFLHSSPADASLQCSFRGEQPAYPRFPAASRASGAEPSVCPPQARSLPRATFWYSVGQTCDGCDTTTFECREPVPCIVSRAEPRAQRPMLSLRMRLPLVQRSPADERERTRRELHRRGQDGTQAPGTSRPTQPERGLVLPRTPAVSSARSRTRTKATPKRPPARCRLWVWAARGAVTTACIGLMPLNLLPERYLVEMRRRVTIATASRAPPRTPWKPPRYSTSSTWQRRRGVRCSSPAHRRACRHLVRDPMGVDRPAVTLGQLRRSSAAAGSRSLDAY